MTHHREKKGWKEVNQIKRKIFFWRDIITTTTTITIMIILIMIPMSNDICYLKKRIKKKKCVTLILKCTLALFFQHFLNIEKRGWYCGSFTKKTFWLKLRDRFMLKCAAPCLTQFSEYTVSNLNFIVKGSTGKHVCHCRELATSRHRHHLYARRRQDFLNRQQGRVSHRYSGSMRRKNTDRE